MVSVKKDINIRKGTGKVLVTGASGFIGGHVVRFFEGQGVDVSCLARENSNISFIEDLPVRIVRGDITDRESLDKAFQGIDLVVHTAGKVDDWGLYEDFYKANVVGTMNVLQAAVANSIKRVIISGSIASYGEEDFRGLKDETSPFHSHFPYFFDKWLPSGMNHYRDTKALCTQKATEFAEQNDLNLTIIEPVWVYGENEFSSGFYEFLKAVKSGMFLFPGRRSNNYHVIYAGDLARGYYLAYANNDLKGVHRFILGNSKPENMNSMYRTFCKAAGLRMPGLLPKFLTYPVGFIMELACHIFRTKNPPVLTRARVNMLYDSIGYDTSKAKEILGFEALMPLDVGISKTVHWYREHHHL